MLHDGSEIKRGKADRFPLRDEAARANAPREEVGEVPLLLDPTAEEPADFVRFIVRDQMRHRARRRRYVPAPRLVRPTSINIYGLNRRRLVRDRSRYLLRIIASIRRLENLARRLDAGTDDAHEIEEDIADDLSFLTSHVDRVDRFTGMARSFVAPALKKLSLTI